MVFTVGLSFALLLWLKHRGAVIDHHISVREDRVPVMALAALSLGAGALLLVLLHAPAELFGPALALLLASAVGWSRVRLGARTPGQVLAGHAVGCAVVPVSLLLP
ncbi:hypothetical protein FQ377_10950 [Arthrobacter echini]|uniref:Uncharacterized protein n=1 Tax=Arthrobacter echini TaxID=1529066 RepID=A0A5D0XPW4_9MICC|nr:hypothetical protein [Arthrobacter echini]TYC98408.1 hypothetical protein FQ377_10950 [Arthrobacter echini]